MRLPSMNICCPKCGTRIAGEPHLIGLEEGEIVPEELLEGLCPHCASSIEWARSAALGR